MSTSASSSFGGDDESSYASSESRAPSMEVDIHGDRGDEGEGTPDVRRQQPHTPRGEGPEQGDVKMGSPHP